MKDTMIVSASTTRAQICRRLLSFGGFGKKLANFAPEDARYLSEGVNPEVDLLPFDLRDRDAL